MTTLRKDNVHKYGGAAGQWQCIYSNTDSMAITASGTTLYMLENMRQQRQEQYLQVLGQGHGLVEARPPAAEQYKQERIRGVRL